MILLKISRFMPALYLNDLNKSNNRNHSKCGIMNYHVIYASWSIDKYHINEFIINEKLSYLLVNIHSNSKWDHRIWILLYWLGNRQVPGLIDSLNFENCFQKVLTNIVFIKFSVQSYLVQFHAKITKRVTIVSELLT